MLYNDLIGYLKPESANILFKMCKYALEGKYLDCEINSFCILILQKWWVYLS